MNGLPGFEALARRLGRPLKVAILSDFTSVPYANGAVFQTRFLYQELRRCGHQVTVVGPHDPNAAADRMPEGTVAFPSVPLKSYPGLYLPMPTAAWIYDLDRWDFDICFAQTTGMLMEFGVWLRRMKGIPLLCVNTTHLEAAYEVVLPESIAKGGMIRAALNRMVLQPVIDFYARTYNESDGLVVLSEGLRDYWRARGVTAHGPRLVCAGRHTREKSQDRIIHIFAEHIAPHVPDATLTLIGRGPDTAFLKRVAESCGVADRVVFTGEVPFARMSDYYAYADVFVHGSMSETYGNVMGEALWCGMPMVAFADGMGVSSQMRDGVNGRVLEPGRTETEKRIADAAYGRAVVELLADPTARARLGTAASRVARERAMPAMVLQKMADAFGGAMDHAATTCERPLRERSRARQIAFTLRQTVPWTGLISALYLLGHLRPKATDAAKQEAKRSSEIHPGIGA